MKQLLLILMLSSAGAAHGSGCDWYDHTTEYWDAELLLDLGQNSVFVDTSQVNIQCAWDHTTMQLPGDSRIFKSRYSPYCEIVKEALGQGSRWITIHRTNVLFHGLDNCNSDNGVRVYSGQYLIELYRPNSLEKIPMVTPHSPFEATMPLFPCPVGETILSEFDIDYVTHLPKYLACIPEPQPTCEQGSRFTPGDAYYTDYTTYYLKLNGRYVFTVQSRHYETTYGGLIGVENPEEILRQKGADMEKIMKCSVNWPH